MGIPFKELIEKHAGGVTGGWDNLLGGHSRRRVGAGAAEIDLRLRADGLRLAEGSEIRPRHGGGHRDGQVAPTSSPRSRGCRDFYKHESCGQCTPCREGTGWMSRVMHRLIKGEADIAEIDLLEQVTRQIEGHTICALGDAAAWPIQGLIRHFRPEIERRIAAQKSGSQPKARGAGTRAMPTLTIDGIEEIDGRGRGRRCCKRAKKLAPRFHASVITNACRSPATAECVWSRWKSRRNQSPPARCPPPTAWWCTPTRTSVKQGARRRDGIPADQPSA